MKFTAKPQIIYPVAACLLIILGWLPFLLKSCDVPANTDWFYFLQTYEAVRKDILEYGQFPFWNPWHFGGTPLYARPQIGIFSLEMLCNLFFGALPGLPVALVIYALFGALGMWFLSGKYVDSPAVRFWSMLLFGLQGTIAIHIAGGHLVMASIAWLPWLIYFALKCSKSLSSALWLGVCAGLMVNQSIHYLSFIMCFLIAFFVLAELYNSNDRLIAVRNLAGAFLVFGTLASFRLITTWGVLKYYQRIVPYHATISPVDFFKALVWPGQTCTSFYPAPVPGWWNWSEIGCYVGIIAVLLFIWSFYKELRWWHWGFFLTFPLVIDSSFQFLPGYWLRELPGFKSLWVITRWRFFTVFFIIIGAVRGLDLLVPMLKQKYKWAVPAIILLSCLGLLYNQYINWQGLKVVSHDRYSSEITLEGNPVVSTKNNQWNQYAATRKGVAMIFAYEPMLGYKSFYKVRSLRIPVESKKYAGEIWSAQGRPFEYKWTPNEITIKSPVDNVIIINQNPGSCWRVDGQVIFPEYMPFETQRMFALNISSGEEYRIYVRPVNFETALIVNAVFALALVIFLRFFRNYGQAISSSS